MVVQVAMQLEWIVALQITDSQLALDVVNEWQMRYEMCL